MWRTAGNITGDRPDLEIRPRPPRDSGRDFQWVASSEWEYDREQSPVYWACCAWHFPDRVQKNESRWLVRDDLTQCSEPGATCITAT
jgi:hypothetical protein